MKLRVLVDSSLWIEYLSKGKRYKSCQKIFEESKIIGVPSVVVFEVCRKVATKVSPEAALSVASHLRQFGTLDLTDEIALHAVDLSIEWKLPMPDSLVLAHAYREDATLVTLDNDFAGIPHAKVLRA